MAHNGFLHPSDATNPNKSDTVRVSTNSRKPVGIYVGGSGGDITLGWLSGDSAVSTVKYDAVPAGTTLWIRGFDFVMSTGTGPANGDFTVLW